MQQLRKGENTLAGELLSKGEGESAGESAGEIKRREREK